MQAKLAVPILAALVLVPIAMASTPPVGGGHYSGRDVPGNGIVTLAVKGNGANFASGTFNLVLLGQAGRGSCVGPAHIALHPSRVRQITRKGTFDLRGSFQFREPSSDPQAFRGTAHAIVRGSFSDHGKRVSGTVQLTVTGRGGLTCHSGLVRYTASLA